ncbi:hypothetical protein OC842_002645 [Tilletia horrida]|uniref:Uncharacterized protein n=1 Tax=Tilletia horrida TaxID=155126 RepID=A0AAN6JM46_9BASI|nr:hypothetical protein OC842_002645 [Tilletia horrida]
MPSTSSHTIRDIDSLLASPQSGPNWTMDHETVLARSYTPDAPSIGLSSQQKVMIGVGVGLVVGLLLTSILLRLLCYARYKRKRAARLQAQAAMGYTVGGLSGGAPGMEQRQGQYLYGVVNPYAALPAAYAPVRVSSPARAPSAPSSGPAPTSPAQQVRSATPTPSHPALHSALPPAYSETATAWNESSGTSRQQPAPSLARPQSQPEPQPEHQHQHQHQRKKRTDQPGCTKHEHRHGQLQQEEEAQGAAGPSTSTASPSYASRDSWAVAIHGKPA